jgi:NAD-dependent deacetylase
VVWFGENIDPDVLERSSKAAATAEVVLSVGTSSLVYPAAGLLHHARRAGAFTAEINPGATGASGTVDLAIAAPAEDALPMLDVRVRMG